MRQPGGKPQTLAAGGASRMLLARFCYQQPVIFPFAIQRQRHTCAGTQDFHTRDRRGGRFFSRLNAVHRIQQTALGFSANRLSFAVSINIVSANTRLKGGSVQAFIHGISLTFGLPNTSLIVANRAVRAKHAATRGIQDSSSRPGFLVAVQ